ncbi:NLI interacting factor-like phosphatase-domain-containing protein [Lineolata rhizophorae]|uniref:Mitochondrial import inner membrane translocase subunit TIM50 n=1 Tax=Lineolata rhizophorae TaxID=578093 RepID=A0A6A6NSD7_9PEZI|nr:NLI interacting factor-like phosphatase-domain-containing protein [Lineolata rhizophorae]
MSYPQPLLLVIDLNGTLVHRPLRNQPKHIIRRPFLAQFLAHLLASFHVMIWSSARPENVHAMVGQILTPQQREQLAAVWARDTLGLSEHEYKRKVQTYKRLSQVWASEDIQRTHPDYDPRDAREGTGWSQRNTLLLDDSSIKAQAEPYNLVQISEFENKRPQKLADELAEVIGYLEEAKWYENVSAFVRAKRFRVGKGWRWDWKVGTEGYAGDGSAAN